MVSHFCSGRLGVAMALLLFASSCARHRVVSLDPPTRHYEPQEYSAVLKAWTRSSRLNTLEEMDNVLTVTSTYYSPEFRAAYLARYTRDFHLSGDEFGALQGEQQRLAQVEHEFYVAMFGQRPDYGRLDDAERTAWQVHLIDDRGHTYKAARIERVKRPSVLERTYFPYTTDFRGVFRVVFSKEGESGAVFDQNVRWFGLRFSGPQGTTILKWHLG